MPDIHSEIEAANVVLVGGFNPRIFQPAWFANHGLLRPEEAELAENLVSTREVTTFATKWLTIQVIPERFQAFTMDAAHFEALRDLVLGTFALLEHTPLEGMGINREFHIKMPSRDRYIRIGHLLVPKEPWRDLLEDPVTRSVTVSGLQKRGDHQPTLQVKVEPSNRVESGIFVSTNEHYQLKQNDPPKMLMMALREHWNEAMGAATRVAAHLLQLT